MFRQPVLYWSGNIVGGGDRSGRHGGVFVEMDDGFVLSVDTPVDRNYFLIELFEVYYLRPGWRSREW